jgi:hypothetical protein
VGAVERSCGAAMRFLGVRPLPELLDDPGQLADRRVRERVREGLRPGGLLVEVAGPVAEPLGPSAPRGEHSLAFFGAQRLEFLGGRLGGRLCAGQQVEVDADDSVAVDAAQFAGDGRTPVAALGAEPLVAQARHELDPGVGDPACLPAGLPSGPGEPEARNARQHHVEGVGPVAAVRGRVRQRADDVQELDDRPRPAVRDDQRGGVGFGGADVCEVHMRAVDLGGELRPLVEPGLGRPPVVLVPPVPDQLPQVVRRYAVRPSHPGQLVGPAGAVEAVVEVVEVALRDVDEERMETAAAVGGRRRHGRDARACSEFPRLRPDALHAPSPHAAPEQVAPPHDQGRRTPRARTERRCARAPHGRREIQNRPWFRAV